MRTIEQVRNDYKRALALTDARLRTEVKRRLSKELISVLDAKRREENVVSAY